jgi:lipopolysaccharide export system permease protein
MALIDRYLFRQLLWPTVLATAALSAVALLTEALSAIGVVLNQRESPLVFVKVVFLAMPQLIVLILPVAALVAGLIAINRLHRDNEIVVCFAAGLSRWRVMSPAIRLAALMATASLLITLWIQPLCYRALRDTLESVRTDLVTSMIRPGQFTHPSAGVTVYAQSLDEDGDIHNLFIDRKSDTGRESTITAREGRMERREGGPVLIMRHGANQEISPTGVLNFLAFDAYNLDLRPLMPDRLRVRYKLSDRYLHELLFPRLDDAWEAQNRRAMLAEAHSRLAAPLYILAFMFLALTAVIGGSFSRTGYGVRIAAVSVAALAARMVGFAVQSASGSTSLFNLLQYAAPALVILVCLGLLLRTRRRTASGTWPTVALATPAKALSH